MYQKGPQDMHTDVLGQTSSHPHPGNQERFIGDVQWGKAVPFLPVHVGLSSLFFLKYDHNDLGGMTDVFHTAILPDDLHLVFLHWD